MQRVQFLDVNGGTGAAATDATVLVLAAAGRMDRSRACVSAENSGNTMPAASQASAHRIAGPPAFVTMPTRRPRGNGWLPRAAARSNISSSVSARMTPVSRNRASTATSFAARAAVCDPAARPPACVRPVLIATTGFRRLTRWAIRANRRGLPNDSR